MFPGSSGNGGASASRQGYFNEPLPDLEQQLAAELSGASWGVIAFTSEDAAWCDWIYRNLNGYPLPPDLVDRVTSQGLPRPDCLSIFPDRRDPAYEEHLPQAIESGSYLIVVCTPQSAHSAAVDNQIRAFKKAGGEERILALVADGPPDARLGEYRRAAQCDWLPAWLRWRLEEEGFRNADVTEPRVIDARCGYRSLKQVRDSLLAALVDVETSEFERLGGFARPVDLPAAPEPEPRHAEEKDSPPMTTATNTINPLAFPPRRGSRYTVYLALLLILVAIIFGTYSFHAITAEEPASTLDVSPMTGVLAGHSAKAAPVDETPAAPALPDVAPATPEPSPGIAVAQSNPPSPEPAPAAPSATTSNPAVPVAPSNVPQIAPPQAWATSRILPVDMEVTQRSNAGVAGGASGSSQPGAVLNAAATASTNSESDAVLLDEVRTLERRGDETMAEKRTEDALDLYHTALTSAEEYATRKGSNPGARDQVVALMRKLGTLQMQNSSTAEARATYLTARRTLLLYKSQGQWTHERAKALDEIESRLLSLPKD